MKIHEYQAKSILASYNIPTPTGRLAQTIDDVRRIAEEIGKPVVIKAQVYAGGRGKAGGIKFASSPVDAVKIATSMLDRTLITHQTSSAGTIVRKVLIEEAVPIVGEIYISIVIDTSKRLPVIMTSSAGGMDIEDIAENSPEKIIMAYVDPAVGFQPYIGRKLAYGIGLSGDLIKEFGAIIAALFKLFMENDCSLAEINPLAVTKDGRLIALDAKLNFDDNALFRHDSIRNLHDPEQDDQFEKIASELGIKNYVKLDGNIGCAVNGAGLAMAALDMIKYAGGRAANFLDIGTVNNPQILINAFKIFMSDPNVKSILINIFGGMARADIIARGIIDAYKQIDIKVPVVIRLAGTNALEGKQMLMQAGINYIDATDFYDAAIKAVSAANN
jgi:succinyl-CoA synthetase beta subunit